VLAKVENLLSKIVRDENYFEGNPHFIDSSSQSQAFLHTTATLSTLSLSVALKRRY
jgi:hypothetical protein